jgi:siroheme synthase (precorrin-2 oxidase/ferrochelatase)
VDVAEVAKEEMLHLALASNTLYALGKPPTLYGQTFIPEFPSNILYTKIKMSLRDGRRENIQTFVDVCASTSTFIGQVLTTCSQIEAPSDTLEDPTYANVLPDYKSIGKFYEAIKTRSISSFFALVARC